MQVRTSNIRRAFTLIELLVVISLILVLATLAVLILPRLGDDQKSVRSADQLSMWLLIAKQRAYRDQAPRGIRLIRNIDDPTQAREAVYIERPEDYLSSNIQIPAPGGPANSGLIRGPDLTNGGTNYIVEAGDVLVFDSLENLPYNSHRIATVTYDAAYGGTVLTFAAADGNVRQINFGVPLPYPNNFTFRIVRRERPLAGEPVLQLPKDMIVDLRPDPPDASGGRMGYSYLPSDPFGVLPSLDVVFNQRGQLMGRNANEGKVILRVRNGSKPEDVGDQFLVVVYTRTGLIAVHPMELTVSPSGPPRYADPFFFTKDGKASGL
jgi:prepilin-type N-terminal cleavage/methylation domain-containing protein